MKDRNDTKTRSLPMSGSASRQARYREEQLKRGRRQRSFWLTDDEALKVRQMLQELRKDEG